GVTFASPVHALCCNTRVCRWHVASVGRRKLSDQFDRRHTSLNPRVTPFPSTRLYTSRHSSIAFHHDEWAVLRVRYRRYRAGFVREPLTAAGSTSAAIPTITPHICLLLVDILEVTARHLRERMLLRHRYSLSHDAGTSLMPSRHRCRIDERNQSSRSST